MSITEVSEKTKLWSARIDEQKASHLSVKEWCARHSIPVTTFYEWKRRLSKKPGLSRASFSELKKLSVESHELVIEHGSFRLILKSFQPELLNECLKVLRKNKC